MLLRILAVLIPVLWASFVSEAGTLPVTLKEASLMLRSGYSSDNVIQEVVKRHFADKLDAKSESQLIQLGATPALVAVIKSGTYSVSPEEAAKVKAIAEAETKRRAAQATEQKKFSTLYQDQLAKERAANLQMFRSGNVTYDYLKGCLVRPSNNGFVRVDDDAIGKKKLIAYYFSAHWCPPCRKFTPQLVEYYNRVVAQHPEFEIVFFSEDKSVGDMEHYMRESNMPWPAIDYAKRQEKAELLKSAGDGIPSLVLVDAGGKMISSSFQGEKYLGPQKVLADLDAIFSGKIAQAQ
ncbi:MAG: thioredoxin-like domain-containing protein [Verrucomicrobiota bacterium]